VVVGMAWEEWEARRSHCHMSNRAIILKESASPNGPKGSVKTL